MLVYRLSREKYADTLSGFGAALSYTNRWNSKGREMIYTSLNIATAMSEILVHVSVRLIPKDYMVIHIEIPDTIIIDRLNDTDLPKNWNEVPPPAETQKIGDQFLIDKEYAGLQVPSAVVNGEYNLLLNPFHHDFTAIKIVKKEHFRFDQRLFIN